MLASSRAEAVRGPRLQLAAAEYHNMRAVCTQRAQRISNCWRINVILKRYTLVSRVTRRLSPQIRALAIIPDRPRLIATCTRNNSPIDSLMERGHNVIKGDSN